MRGGDFWQGAAAGFVSSFAGSAAQGVGIHGWGMVGVSAASGGIGSAIVGGKAEDILFGIVQGAMVGTLNHLATERLRSIEMKNVWGKMHIISYYGNGDLTDGHAWIRLESSDGKIIKTLSLYSTGYSDGNELKIDQDKSYGIPTENTSVKSVSISKSMYYEALKYSLNNQNWTAFNTCAGFSAGLWNHITNQNLSATDILWFTTPRSLATSINNSK